MKAMKATVIHIKDLGCLENLYTAVKSHGLDLEACALDENALILMHNGKSVLRKDLHDTFAAIEGVTKVKTRIVAIPTFH